MALPTNDTLVAYSHAIDWQEIEQKRRAFNKALETLASDDTLTTLPIAALSEAVGAPVQTSFDVDHPETGNVFYVEINGRRVVLGSMVSARYRSGASIGKSIVPYNLNPSVNHTNITETEDSLTHLRVLGAEIELGLVHGDGAPPSEDDVQGFMQAYYNHALRIGVYPRLDREACQYQVEAHIAPSLGYHKTRSALNGILSALAASSQETGLRTLVFATYPTESDFKMAPYPKVATAVDLMLEVNGLFPEYGAKLLEAQQRYAIDPATCHHVNMFRNQGCHIHIDIAGRSEALGLLTFHTMLKSATAVANGAVLKGSPFVNGTCDPELLCTREYLRGTTATGRYLDIPLSPHFDTTDFGYYAELLKLERANATGRANMYEWYHDQAISLMHNPIGRVRPDLSTSKRVCTVESTGMPTNISASRMAAVLVDFEFSHVVIEAYFRKHGCDLEPMYADKNMWDMLGPIELGAFQAMQDESDRLGSEITLKLHSGREVSLSEFYVLKRKFMHRVLEDVDEVSPREIDDVYMSLERMIEPPTGHAAETVEQYILDPKLRSTGNWGKILRNSFIEEGGVVGDHCPDAVLRVINRVHDAMTQRYLPG